MIQPITAKTRPGCELFPRIVHSLEELPEPMSDLLSQVRFRQIIHLPSHSYPVRRTFWRFDLTLGWRRTPPRTLVFSDEQILIIEGLSADSLRTIEIPLDCLLSIRLVSVLLYMYVELTWMAADRTEALKIEFNAVGERMIKRELDQARTTIAKKQPRLAPPVSLKHFPFKFQTYTYGDLLPGEQILLGVYEPRIRTTNQYLRTYMSPNRALVLTDQHLLVLQDQNRIFGDTDLSSYWMDRCFYPRAHVQNVKFEDEPNVTWMDLFLTGETVRYPLTEPRAAELREPIGRWLEDS
jgi:hypothetical protein